MNELFWYWLSAAAVLIIIEMLTPSFFALLFAVAALVVAGLVALTSINLQWQLTIFAVMAVINFIFWLKIARHWYRQDRQANKLNQRSQQYLGRKLLLKEELQHHQGKIQIGDTFWKVQFKEEVLPANQMVEVIAVQDNSLTIRAV